MFGWDEDEGIGLDFYSQIYYYKVDGSIYLWSDCLIFKMLNDGQWWQVKDNFYWCKDGIFFLVEFIVVVMEQDGKISGVVNVFCDIIVCKKFEEWIMYMVMFDELIGLFNCFFLFDVLCWIVVFIVCCYEEVGILYVDFDGFKCINDCMGYVVGDLVLCEVVVWLGVGVWVEDVVVWLGGDEFLVVIQMGSENVWEYCIVLV